MAGVWFLVSLPCQASQHTGTGEFHFLWCPGPFSSLWLYKHLLENHLFLKHINGAQILCVHCRWTEGQCLCCSQMSEAVHTGPSWDHPTQLTCSLSYFQALASRGKEKSLITWRPTQVWRHDFILKEFASLHCQSTGLHQINHFF